MFSGPYIIQFNLLNFRIIICINIRRLQCLFETFLFWSSDYLIKKIYEHAHSNYSFHELIIYIACDFYLIYLLNKMTVI